MTCDIIIPTFNNAVVLPHALTALTQQGDAISSIGHLIISDDGSTDSTAEVVSAWEAANTIPVRYVKGEHGGAAAARNRALKHATADLILFLQADILLRPRALAAHLAFHLSHPEPEAAALGWVVWDPRLHPTPFMEWMVHGGPQNQYDTFLGKPLADATCDFYGAHVSLKRRFIGNETFSQDFQEYGWEDIEFGARLADRGLRLYPLPQAIGLHRHYYTAAMIAARQKAVGRGIKLFRARRPQAAPTLSPTLFRRIKYYIVRWSGVSAMIHAIVEWRQQQAMPRLFMLITAIDFWRGVFSAQVGKK